MTGPVLTKALSALRDGFDAAFPDRDTTTDGWIGDTAHQQEVSGHNPDDTPGVRAEYSDADTVPEVRAVDVDKDLRSADGTTMYDVIKRILATPADLKRLKYMIHAPAAGPLGANVPTIWSRSAGWRPAPYSGASPHDEHAHFSGDPVYDEDDSPWSVATMGDDMTPAQQYVQHVQNYRIDAILHMRPTCNVPAFTATDGSKFPAINENNDLAAAIRGIDVGTPPDPDVVEQKIKEALTDPAVLAAQADATADEMAQREADAARAEAAALEGTK